LNNYNDIKYNNYLYTLVKKFLLFVGFFVCFISFTSKSQITKYFGSSNIYLDEIGVINFLRYLNGTFYSEDVPQIRATRIMSPMFYALSEDGKIGYGWFCNSHLSKACSEDSIAFKVVEFCKEYSKMKCSIFAHENEIVWNNLNVKVSNKKFNDNVKLFMQLNIYNNNSSKKITEENYINYVNQDSDKCTSLKKIADDNILRGSSLDCLLPGRYQLIINETSGDSIYD